MYNPIIGRWISSDPLTKRDGPSVVRSFVAMRIPSALVLRWETYRYASNNPTNSIDPSGLYSLNDAVEEDCHNVLSHQDSAAYRDVPYTRRMKECRDILWKDRQLVFQIWYELEKKDLATWHKDLPDCPCTITETISIRKKFGVVYWVSHRWSHNDPNFKDPTTLHDGAKFHPGAHREIRSVSANAFDAGQQCTYDKCGRLITEGFGAGTADRQHGVLSNLFDHRAHDVKPFDLAYELDGSAHGDNVEKYIDVRPPNKGKDSDGNPCPTNKQPP